MLLHLLALVISRDTKSQ